jgi:hypothetical protein
VLDMRRTTHLTRAFIESGSEKPSGRPHGGCAGRLRH